MSASTRRRWLTVACILGLLASISPDGARASVAVSLVYPDSVVPPPDNGQVPARRYYSVKRESSVGTYMRARHVIRHQSLTGPGTGANVRIDCGYSYWGDDNFALQNIWLVFPGSGTGTESIQNQTARWMETSAYYACGPNTGNVHRRRIRSEIYYNAVQRIMYYGSDFSDTNTHTYEIFHNTADGAGRISWFYDGIRTSYQSWSPHAPHGAYIEDGLEVTNADGYIFVGRHQYDSLSYGTSDANGAYTLASYEGRNYMPGKTGFQKVSGSNHYGCLRVTDTC